MTTILSPASQALLAEFERGLDPQYPERSKIPARVLGYGEISTVFEIQAEGLRGWAFKRLPLFNAADEVEKYRTTFIEYNRLLEEEVGIRLPQHDYVIINTAKGRPVFYIIQKQLAANAIGNRALKLVPRERAGAFIQHILREARTVWDFNRRQQRVQLAIDGQISNWVLHGFNPTHPQFDNTTLLYVDTSTPLFRVNGIEQLDTELFLRSAPSFMVWILRLLFVKDVVNRYYDFRRNTVDLVANLYKEQCADLIPEALQTVNTFFAGEVAEFNIQSITPKEISDYYKEDAMIWSLYFSMRKVDRFLRRRVLRQDYPYLLPDKIAR